jgi:hypothetical protein
MSCVPHLRITNALGHRHPEGGDSRRVISTLAPSQRHEQACILLQQYHNVARSRLMCRRLSLWLSPLGLLLALLLLVLAPHKTTGSSSLQGRRSVFLEKVLASIRSDRAESQPERHRFRNLVAEMPRYICPFGRHQRPDIHHRSGGKCRHAAEHGC